MNVLNYINKYKILFIILIVLITIVVVINYHPKLIEGYTTCGNLDNTSCDKCTNASITDTSSPCYWNNEKKLCRSFNDPGYSRTCSTVDCSVNTNCASCIANGCYWDASANKCGTSSSGSNYKNTCPVTPSCERYTDCSACTTNNCFWNKDANIKCASFPSQGYRSTCGDPKCDIYNDCTSCINDNCYWNPSTTSNKKCKLNGGSGYTRSCAIDCSLANNCQDCIAKGCYWDASTNKCGPSSSGGNYKNTCPTPDSLLCENSTDCSTCTSKQNCYWNSNVSKCKSTSGSGYSKICNNNTCPNLIKLPYEDIFIKSPN